MQVEVPPEYLVDVRRSANAPILWLGCSPLWLISLMMVAGCLFYSLWTAGFWIALLISGLVFYIGFRVLQYVGEKDPIYLTIYLHSLRHKRGFWTARPSDEKGEY